VTSANQVPPLRSDESVVSTRDLADLARAGYEILQQPFTHVDFEVHHNTDRPGYLRDKVFVCSHRNPRETRANATPSADTTPSIIVQTLASGANGVGLVVGTSGRSEIIGPEQLKQLRGSAPKVLVDESGRRVFRGTALPNPTFLFESAQTYEGIVSVAPSPTSIKFYQAIAVRDLIHEISRLAAEVAQAPLLFMQAPAQLPPTSYTGQDVMSTELRATRRSSSLAVRFAVALPQPSASLRFRLTDILSQYCSEKKFGLWLADTRIGYRSGNWFQICQYPEDLPRRERRDRAESRDSRAVEIILPVTFVGPARVGSTHTLVSFISQFDNVGIVSCSVTTFNDLLFIHVDLVLKGMRRPDRARLNDDLSSVASWPADPSQALMSIYGRLNRENAEASDDIRAGVLKHCGDYQTMVGPVIGCTMPERRKRLAVWLSWQMVGTDDEVAIPLVELLGCFPDVGLVADEVDTNVRGGRVVNLEYFIVRDVGNSVFRARGKLSISEADILELFGSRIEDAAVRLCMTLEDAWKASLRRRGVRGVSELTVTWHEWWLGHWASPI
jgi:hypothetical protein